MTITGIFIDYFETNHFTLCLILTLAGFWVFRFAPKGIQWNPRTILTSTIILGLLLRLAWLAYSSYTPKTVWDPTHMIESDVANINALDLTKGIWFFDQNGNPSGRRPIGYPMLLGLFYAVFGKNAVVLYGMNLALYVAAVFLLYRIALLLFGEPAALLAAFLFSIYPISVYSIKMATDEHLFLPLWYAGLYLLLLELRGRRVPWVILLYGLLFGYSTMTRTHSIFMPFVVALAYLWLKRPWKKIAAAFIGIYCVMMLMNLPWMIRNRNVFGENVLYTATNMFIYPAVNSTSTFEGGRFPAPGDVDYSAEFEAARLSGNEGRFHTAAGKAMTQWMVSHPLRVATIGAGRLLIFMGWDRKGVWPIWFQYQGGSFDPARPMPQNIKTFFEEAAYSFYYIVFFCTLAAAVVLWRERRLLASPVRGGLWMIAACFGFWFLEQMIIYPDRKYRFPLEPLMMAATAYALVRLSGFGRPAAISEMKYERR